MTKGRVALLVVFAVLILDQLLKIWIKTHMVLGEEFKITDWFIIHFTENNGMAFGMELGGSMGKLLLSLFRLVAIGAIIWYIIKLVKTKGHTGLIISVSFILAGAVGNLIDSAFYGLMFNESYYKIAEFLPHGGGYAGFLHGKVVDMLYFPLIQGHFPQWVPMWGGDDFEFFRPVFNLADSSITVGVTLILLFQKKFFKES